MAAVSVSCTSGTSVAEVVAGTITGASGWTLDDLSAMLDNSSSPSLPLNNFLAASFSCDVE